ncbi:hypothetical protein R1flu_024360 [Riccia fluitans]|uniref:Uncharacterized protein n=1 Tax=Riccia fluitans TaxID=41844 RepID=A0ABD1XUN8_9MARC
MATLPTSCGMIDPHLGSVGITSVASDSCSSSCGSPPKTFNMRDLLNAARKTPSGNGGMWKGMKLPMQKLKTSMTSLEMTEVHLTMKREGGRKKSLNFQRAVQK